MAGPKRPPAPKPLPADTRDLIAYLDEQFPARCIRPDETEAAARHYAGQRSIVEWLKEIQRKYEERSNILNQ